MKRSTTMLVCLSILAVASVLGCEPEYDGLIFSLESDPPGTVEVGRQEVEISSGVAAMFHVDIESRGPEAFDDSTELELVSQDTDVFLVRRGEGAREFVLIGVWEGETEMEVRLDCEVVDRVNVTCR